MILTLNTLTLVKFFLVRAWLEIRDYPPKMSSAFKYDAP